MRERINAIIELLSGLPTEEQEKILALIKGFELAKNGEK